MVRDYTRQTLFTLTDQEVIPMAMSIVQREEFDLGNASPEHWRWIRPFFAHLALSSLPEPFAVGATREVANRCQALVASGVPPDRSTQPRRGGVNWDTIQVTVDAGPALAVTAKHSGRLDRQ
jgi:hypothetical protein